METINNDNWAHKWQNLEVENVMLKNEVNVMNREVADLLDRLRKNEDGNELVEVVCSQGTLKIHNIFFYELSSDTSQLKHLLFLKQKLVI